MSEDHAVSKNVSLLDRSLGKLLLACALLSSILTFFLIPLADSSSRLNAKQVFDSSRWHSLQLQLQTYRLMDYVSSIQASDLPLQGNAYFQYDLVLSRVDLLRKGELGRHIRGFANGRVTRLLNIISGELELISLNIDHLERGDLGQVTILMERLRALDSQVSDFVVIVNQSANDFVTKKRAELDNQIESIQLIALLLLLLTGALFLISFKLAKKLEGTYRRNKRLEERIKDIQFGKLETIRQMNMELKMSLKGTLNSSHSLLQQDLSEDISLPLSRIVSNHQQVLTQLDCYQDLSLIEAKQFQIQSSTGSLREHLSSSLDSLSQIINSYRIHTLCSIDPRLNDQVDTDFHRLHEIISTLITQLAPFCQGAELLIQVRPSTLPILDLSARAHNQATKMVQISIRDNGDGLPEAIQSGLRCNPHNPNNTIMSQVKNMGLGFTFCHFLIGALNGELHFSSTDKGSEIWIDVPMGVDDYAASNTDSALNNYVLAILETDGLLDQALINAFQPRVKTIAISEASIKEHLTASRALPFHALFIHQTTLSSAQLDCLLHLKEFGVKLIMPEALVRSYPELHSCHYFRYPITPVQMQSILAF